MSAHLANVTFDCEDALAVASFWSAALDRPLSDTPEPSSGFACIGALDHTANGAPAWLFQRVPEPRAAKNRVHVDLATADREAEIARLVGLGARRLDDKEEYGFRWTIMADVEGNEFCVAQED
jgi:predicted enzyme related to lactoylglutathione lyase